MRIIYVLYVLYVYGINLHAETEAERCARARAPIEKLMYCQSGDLAIQDTKMNALYNDLAKLLLPGEMKTLREEQRKWLATRDACLGATATKNNPDDLTPAKVCVLDALKSRQKKLAELKARKSPAAMMTAAPKFQRTSTDGKLVFYDADYFAAYEKLAVQYKLPREKMEVFDGEARLTVGSCAELFDARNKIYFPKTATGFAGLGTYPVCDLLPVFEKAEKPKAPLREAALLGQLWAYFNALEMDAQGKAKPMVDGMGYVTPDEKMKVLARGDFNHDGIEDVLVQRNRRANNQVIDAFSAYTIRPGESGLTEILEDCGANDFCLVGGHKVKRDYGDRPTGPTGSVIGFEYSAKPGSPKFASFTFPLREERQKPYRVSIWKDGKYEFYKEIAPNLKLDFPTGGVERIRLEGVNPELKICPRDKFPVAVLFASTGQLEVTKVPLTTKEINPRCSTK